MEQFARRRTPCEKTQGIGTGRCSAERIGLKDGRERERGEEEEDKEVFEGLSRVVGPNKKARLDLHDNPS